MLFGSLEPSRSACVGPLGMLRGPGYGTEKDFNPHVLQIAFLKLYDLVESLLRDRRFGLLKVFVLTLDNCAAHGALAFCVAFDASREGHVEKNQSGRDPEFLREIEQIPPRLRGQCR
jgi:hypothetical protein